MSLGERLEEAWKRIKEPIKYPDGFPEKGILIENLYKKCGFGSTLAGKVSPPDDFEDAEQAVSKLRAGWNIPEFTEQRKRWLKIIEEFEIPF